MQAAVFLVAERLLAPEAVIAAVRTADVASLTDGLAGTALLHARLAVADRCFVRAAGRHWTAAARWLEQNPAGFSGIQGGQGALAASLIIGTSYLPEPDRYEDVVARSASWLSARACDIAQRYPDDATPSRHFYDTITGLSGVGHVLLAAYQSGHAQVEAGLVAALTTLTALLSPPEGSRPGWHEPTKSSSARGYAHPSGTADTGLAHGVAGPLAFLAEAAKCGLAVPGQARAIHYAATWLLRWRRPDGRWPPHVTGDELDHGGPPHATGRHDAWCYGTPGIAHALTLAGVALGDHQVVALAEEALARLADRAPQTWDVEGPTLCHGYAGVLQSGAVLPHLAEQAANALTGCFDPTSRFGFQHHEHGQRRDNPGLLTGAAGAALALADAFLPAPAHASRWSVLLNLSARLGAEFRWGGEPDHQTGAHLPRRDES